MALSWMPHDDIAAQAAFQLRGADSSHPWFSIICPDEDDILLSEIPIMTATLAVPTEAPAIQIVPPPESLMPASAPPAEAPLLAKQPSDSAFDKLLIWICIACWALLVGTHVYELVIWMFG
jgi:hypothetical protein